MIHDLAFRKLDRVRRRLLLHATELGYVCLHEVLHRHKCVPLARIEFSAPELAPYMDDQDEEDEEIEQPPALGALEEGEEDEDEDSSDDPTAGSEVDPAEEPSELSEATQRTEAERSCDAVVVWAQAEVDELMAGRPSGTFKLMLYRHKGGYIASQHFGVFNHGYQPPRPAREAQPAPRPSVTSPPATPAAPPIPEPTPPTPVPPQLPAVATPAAPTPVIVAAPLPAPRPTPAVAIALSGDGDGQLIYLDPDTIPEARVWRALGRATEDFLATVGRTYGDIIDLQSRTVSHQAAQLDKSQALVENLATQLLAARHLQANDASEQKADEQQLRVREELGKTFLSELGSLGRVLASSKLGVPPELVELGDLVSTSPELADAIRDPSVRALLKEESTRKELAQLLLLAAKKPKDPGESTPPRAA